MMRAIFSSFAASVTVRGIALCLQPLNLLLLLGNFTFNF